MDKNKFQEPQQHLALSPGVFPGVRQQTRHSSVIGQANRLTNNSSVITLVDRSINSICPSAFNCVHVLVLIPPCKARVQQNCASGGNRYRIGIQRCDWVARSEGSSLHDALRPKIDEKRLPALT